MDDLTGRYPQALVPTSQSDGGEVHDNSLAMTAPGSEPVSAPAPAAPAPMPHFSNSGQLTPGPEQAESDGPFRRLSNGTF